MLLLLVISVLLLSILSSVCCRITYKASSGYSSSLDFVKQVRGCGSSSHCLLLLPHILRLSSHWFHIEILPCEIHPLFNLRHHWRIRLNDRGQILHEVLNVGLVAHVPACQIRNGDLVELAKVVLVSDNGRLKLHVDVHLWWSEWVPIHQDDLYGELGVWLSNLYEALEHQHVGGRCLPRKLHGLHSGFEVGECHQEVNGLLHDEVGVLTVVDEIGRAHV